MASEFEFLSLDSVQVQGNIEDTFVRLSDAAPAGDGLPRQGFKFKETVKTFPGISALDIIVNLEGCFTWDENRRVSLYETASSKS